MTAINYPYGLKGIQQANTCPFCGREGGVSLENQEFSLSNDDSFITIQRGFDCMYCCDSWWQTVEVKLGETIKNEVELGD